MSGNTEQLYSQEYFEYLRNRGSIRKFIRTFYLRDIRNYCKGKTIDFGCGTGELLARLPAGSAGFEINPVAVEFCKSQGLDVRLYDPADDDYRFEMIRKDEFNSFTMNHVLEHLENSYAIMNKIFESCKRLGIKRIVFTVPGQKGFRSDKTHLTFIDRKYLEDNGLTDHKYYKLNFSKYFPVNWRKFSQYFTHNELRLVFDKKND